MKNNSRLVPLASFTVGLIALVGFSFTAGTLYGREGASVSVGMQASLSEQGKVYTNAQSHFSLLQPPSLAVVQEQGGTVTFKANEDEPWVITVTAEKTMFESTDAWLHSQPKGSPSKEGVAPLFFVDGKAILAEYVAVDQEGGAPVLGKTVSAVVVKNGFLYRIQFHGQYQVDETPSLDERFLNAVRSFKAR